jgi:riboflavin kinase / FMN adenylyltransferase
VSILGTVVKGISLARELGYPTANVNPHHEVIPPSGVYAVKVLFKGRTLKGVLNIGTRTIFFSPRDRETSIEVHIFNFQKRIYGEDLEILFVKKLRDEIKFKNRDELIRRIRQDVRDARRLF